MKIEYFHPVGKERPVVLIYGNEPKNVETLKNVVHDLAGGQRQRAAVHELPGFESVDGCQLFFSTGSYDRGLVLISPPKTFELRIRPVWWDNIEGLLEPFCEPGSVGFNDLDYGFSSNIDLIISRDRGW